MWASVDRAAGTAAQLPSLPKVDGIWVQGGTDGVLKAFVDAKRKPLPPTAGEAENGFRKFMLPQGYKGSMCRACRSASRRSSSLVSLELARQVLFKKHPKGEHRNPVPVRDRQDREAG